MKHTTHFTLSPQQCRVLSMLAVVGAGGISCTELAKRALIDRAVLYVLVRRLAARKWVRRRVVILRGTGRRDAPTTHVLYALTAAGAKARERFARELGFLL